MPMIGRVLVGVLLTASAGTALAWTCRTRMVGQMDHETLRGGVIAHVVVVEKVTPPESDRGDKAARLRVVNPVARALRGEEFLLVNFAPWDRLPQEFEVGSEWVIQMGLPSKGAYFFWPRFEGMGRLAVSSYCSALYSVRDGKVEGPLWGSSPNQLTMPLREFIAAYSKVPPVVVP
jgi:hypothetical protein